LGFFKRKLSTNFFLTVFLKDSKLKKTPLAAVFTEYYTGIMKDCIFCKIVKREAPAEIILESKRVVAFPDIDPSADTHILIIPKKHVETFLDIEKKHTSILEEMLKVAQKLIKSKKLIAKYRISFNGGSLQVVPHLHMHLMAGNLKKHKND